MGRNKIITELLLDLRETLVGDGWDAERVAEAVEFAADALEMADEAQLPLVTARSLIGEYLDWTGATV